MKDLSKIKAVISGGASGLGYATADKIVNAGGQVAILNINKTKGDKAAENLGDRAIFIETDVTSENAVDTAIATIVNTFGSINLAVNCAGVAPSKRVLPKEGLATTQEFSDVITTNLVSTFCVIRAVANVMQHNEPGESDERGVIINTASIAAFDGQIGQAAYAASKGGVVSMTLPLAREFARIGVRVIAIAPGLFHTPMIDTLPEKAIDALRSAAPFPHRFGNPAEFADLVIHIYQNLMLNGETIRLDGALRM